MSLDFLRPRACVSCVASKRERERERERREKREEREREIRREESSIAHVFSAPLLVFYARLRRDTRSALLRSGPLRPNASDPRPWCILRMHIQFTPLETRPTVALSCRTACVIAAFLARARHEHPTTPEFFAITSVNAE